MSNFNSILIPRASFADLPLIKTTGRGVIATERTGIGIATIMVRKGKSADLMQRMQAQLKIKLPEGPYRTSLGGLSLAGIGPGAWLAMSEGTGNAFAVSLKGEIAGFGSVCDQSDGYAVLRLAGASVREVLCKLIPVDVDASIFRIGDVAVTVAAHIGVTLWRLDDAADSSPVFEIAVYRSFAASFWRALSEGAAEFGLVRGA